VDDEGEVERTKPAGEAGSVCPEERKRDDGRNHENAQEEPQNAFFVLTLT
jgi:hypothetical protein